MNKKARLCYITIFSDIVVINISGSSPFAPHFVRSFGGYSLSNNIVCKLRDRLMVGHGPLEAGILVRVQVPQPSLVIDR